MKKRLLLLLTVLAWIGYATQRVQAQCNGPLSVTITGSSTGLPLSATASFTPVSCNGGSDGTATVTPAGGSPTYSYVWSDPGAQTSATATGLAAGTYTVTVTDLSSCMTTTSVVVTEPAVLSATVSKTDVTCNGADDGTITVSAPTGGYGTYEYRLDAGTWQSSGSFTGLAPGTYSVQIRDAAQPACVIVLGDQTITQPSTVTITSATVTSNYNGAQVSCASGQGTDDDGEITVVATGGTAPLMYSNDNGGTFQAGGVFAGLTAGTYSIVVKDANGCTTSASVTITPPPAIVAGTCTNTNDQCQVNAGEIKVEASGGTGVLNITWTATLIPPFTGPATGTPAGTAQPVPNTPGPGGSITYSGLSGNTTYDFVVADANGCQVP